MHLDPVLPTIVAVLLVIVVVGLLLKKLKQPNVVAYIIVGILVGPHAMNLISDEVTTNRLGSMGVVLLMFFIGMQVSPKKLFDNWRLAIVGTFIQIVASVGIIWIIGLWLNWSLNRILLLGFVISLSSTAVVLKLLQDRNELDTSAGRDVLGILLIQDIAIIPMLIIIGLRDGDHLSISSVSLLLAGGLGMIALVAWVLSQKDYRLRITSWVSDDPEIQVFAALIICFGLSLLSSLVGLSTALGAFVAGLIVASARETQWVREALEPFRVVLVALFFVSIGMLVNLTFLQLHWVQILTLVIAVLLTNTLINAGIVRAAGNSWQHSLYVGVLLSQIGEFSFVLASVGHQANILNGHGYKLAITVIACSLVVSPAWIMSWSKILKYR